jgi:hypothetical protein
MHIVTSAHVVHPFAFPKYYPPDQHAWLQFVGEQHVMTKLEVREQAEGKVIFESTLHDKVLVFPLTSRHTYTHTRTHMHTCMYNTHTHTHTHIQRCSGTRLEICACSTPKTRKRSCAK